MQNFTIYTLHHIQYDRTEKTAMDETCNLHGEPKKLIQGNTVPPEKLKRNSLHFMEHKVHYHVHKR
jgi:hypothetical protein